MATKKKEKYLIIDWEQRSFTNATSKEQVNQYLEDVISEEEDYSKGDGMNSKDFDLLIFDLNQVNPREVVVNVNVKTEYTHDFVS